MKRDRDGGADPCQLCHFSLATEHAKDEARSAACAECAAIVRLAVSSCGDVTMAAIYDAYWYGTLHELVWGPSSCTAAGPPAQGRLAPQILDAGASREQGQGTASVAGSGRVTAASSQQKICRMCGETLPLDSFPRAGERRKAYCCRCIPHVRRGMNAKLNVQTMREAFEAGGYETLAARVSAAMQGPETVPDGGVLGAVSEAEAADMLSTPSSPPLVHASSEERVAQKPSQLGPACSKAPLQQGLRCRKCGHQGELHAFTYLERLTATCQICQVRALTESRIAAQQAVPEGFKLCKLCYEAVPQSDFNQCGPTHLASYCRRCDARRARCKPTWNVDQAREAVLRGIFDEVFPPRLLTRDSSRTALPCEPSPRAPGAQASVSAAACTATVQDGPYRTMDTDGAMRLAGPGRFQPPTNGSNEAEPAHSDPASSTGHAPRHVEALYARGGASSHVAAPASEQLPPQSSPSILAIARFVEGPCNSGA